MPWNTARWNATRWNTTRFSRRDAQAWTAALLLHALAALALLRHAPGPHAPDTPDNASRRAFTVRLIAPRPPQDAPAAEPEPERQPAAAPERPRVAAAPRPQRATAPPSLPPAVDAHAPDVAAAPAAGAAAGAPAAGAPAAETPAAEAPAGAAAPKFNRAAASKTVREFAAELNRRPGAAAEWQPTRDEKLGRAIEASRKSDCKSAYSGAGLFAPLLLARDALRQDGNGCKW